MRARLGAALTALLGLVLAGCTASEGPRSSPSPTPTSQPARLYAVSDKLCGDIDYGLLQAALGEPAQPTAMRISNEARSSGWTNTDNYLYDSGVQCWHPYGTEEVPHAVLFVIAAAYKSADGARIPYAGRKDADVLTDAALPIGAETVSRGSSGSIHVVYVKDSNLFVEIRIMMMGEDETVATRVPPAIPSAMETFANHVLGQLRKDFIV